MADYLSYDYACESQCSFDKLQESFDLIVPDLEDEADEDWENEVEFSTSANADWTFSGTFEELDIPLADESVAAAGLVTRILILSKSRLLMMSILVLLLRRSILMLLRRSMLVLLRRSVLVLLIRPILVLRP